MDYDLKHRIVAAFFIMKKKILFGKILVAMKVASCQFNASCAFAGVMHPNKMSANKIIFSKWQTKRCKIGQLLTTLAQYLNYWER